MESYILKEIKTKQDEILFLNMPNEIYNYDTNWIRPLDNDIKGVFNPQKNLLFKEGEAIRWILLDKKNTPVGRIAAFYNIKLAEKGYCKSGGCGFFECIDSQIAANVLFDTSVKWLSKRGIQAMDGSINFGERDLFWGVLVNGFHHPMYGANYNKPYYGKLFEQYGFHVYFNQHSYYKSFDVDTLNPAIVEKAKRLAENPAFEFRSLRKSELENAPEMLRSVYNRAWANFDDIAEMSEKQAESMVKMMKPILDIDVIIFAFHNNQPIGFFIAIPDINLAIKGLNGSLKPINLIKFLYRLKIKKACNIVQGIVFGVTPEFQGKGVESGMIMAMSDVVRTKNRYKHLEIMWIGDFNPLMMRMVEKYVCAEKYKQFVTYRYMIDKSIEFQRAQNVSYTRSK